MGQQQRSLVGNAVFDEAFGDGGEFSALQLPCGNAVATVFRSLFQDEIRKNNFPSPLKGHRVCPAKPAVQHIPKRLPQALAALARRVGVVRKNLAVCRQYCPRHQHVDLKTPCVCMRADQRCKTSLVRYPGIGAFLEQPQRTADLIAQNTVATIEGRRGNVLLQEGQCHRGVAVLRSQATHNGEHQIGVSQQQLRCRIPSDGNPFSREIFPRHFLQEVDDGAQDFAADRVAGMRRKAEDHLLVLRLVSCAQCLSIAMSSNSKPGVHTWRLPPSRIATSPRAVSIA
ncbi:hypothetical protein Mame_01340 [Martelella mediterranea DSM 17316]|uniref:Uncharacterized protein n=1 Tax=Martelella mediterranea DSM 17316 TaxID=1122214 RepID=A0A1U9YZ28_9HYPH|nr:hypothetical protein Mame_01340 [Martelella mediterranea DSM 17316]